jgi:hypothetical protein
MGAEYYSSWVPGIFDPETALKRAKLETFLHGRFRGSESNPATPEAALAASGESGTGSVLDIHAVSETEEPGSANGLDQDEIMMYFGTPFPSRAAIETCDGLAADIGRGCARIVAAYDAGFQAGWIILGVSTD